MRYRSCAAALTALLLCGGAVANAATPLDTPARITMPLAATRPFTIPLVTTGTVTTPLAACRIPGIAHEVQCGAVRRPLDPARGDGVQIDVHYVVVPALARRKLADPVFLLAGGPGQSAIAVAAQVWPLFARLNNRRDIVFVDQRGTGRSAPLDCADTRREPLIDRTDPERQVAQLARCRTALEALPHVGGRDGLRFYATTPAMHDLDAVRRALGAPRIDLVGASYGTRAALEYMRLFPEAVRRVVLDGVVPPDMALPASYSTDAQAALDAVFAGCAAEAACARAHPRLHADWQALLASLPKSVVVADPVSGALQPLLLTRDVVLDSVRGPLYAPSIAAALPAAFEAAAHGRYEGLVGLASMLGSSKAAQLSIGMHFSVVCAEDAPLLERASDRPGADFGDDLARLYARVCAGWPRADVAPGFYRVGPSRAPVLLLSGGKDPAAPPRHAARVAAALGPAARSVVVANAGHGVTGLPCIRDVVFRFIDADSDAEAGSVDASCAARVPRPFAFEPMASASAASR
jgi:pimeloyl-ACP methyl ester carboxylesterase